MNHESSYRDSDSQWYQNESLSTLLPSSKTATTPRNCNDCPPFRQSLEFPNQLIQLGFSTKILSSLCSMDLVQLLHALTCHRLFFHLDLSSAFCSGDQIFHIRFSLPGGEMTRCNKDTLFGTDLLSTMFGPKERKTMPFSFGISALGFLQTPCRVKGMLKTKSLPSTCAS